MLWATFKDKEFYEVFFSYVSMWGHRILARHLERKREGIREYTAELETPAYLNIFSQLLIQSWRQVYAKCYTLP